jgi:hypothetical protein
MNNYFETNSLPLSVALLCLGFALDSIEKSTDGKALFIFLQSKELNSAIQLYWHRELKIDPISFWQNQKFLKSRMYELIKT